MDLLQQKQSLDTQIATLFGPLLRLAQFPEQFSPEDRTNVIAQYCAEYQVVINAFSRFSLSRPGYHYAVQHQHFRNALNAVYAKASSVPTESMKFNRRGLVLGLQQTFEEVVLQSFETARTALNEVPIPPSVGIYLAKSPFTVYCTLKALCEVEAIKALVWVDPFMSAALFSRYLQGVRSDVQVTLVTGVCGQGKKDQTRRSDFLDVSRLYAQERGPARYRLVISLNVHDRWLVLDESRFYHLGSSAAAARDAAEEDPYTISELPTTEERLTILKDMTDNGTEYFGSSTLSHL